MAYGRINNTNDATQRPFYRIYFASNLSVVFASLVSFVNSSFLWIFCPLRSPCRYRFQVEKVAVTLVAWQILLRVSVLEI